MKSALVPNGTKLWITHGPHIGEVGTIVKRLDRGTPSARVIVNINGRHLTFPVGWVQVVKTAKAKR